MTVFLKRQSDGPLAADRAFPSMLLGPGGLCNARGGANGHEAPPLSALAQIAVYVPSPPPPPKSLGGLHEGIGAGSAAGIEGAAGFGAERRFGAALRAVFFLDDLFADALTVLRFLLAGAAFFFFLVDRFFAFVLFAMLDLPILL